MSITQENGQPIEVRAIEGFINLINAIAQFTEFRIELSNGEELKLQRHANGSYTLANVKSGGTNEIVSFPDLESAVHGLEQIKAWELQLVPDYFSQALYASSYWNTFRLRRSIYLHIDERGEVVETVNLDPLRPYLHINHRGDNIYAVTFCSMTELTEGVVKMPDGVGPLLDWLKNRVEHRYETMWVDSYGRALRSKRDGYVPALGDVALGESFEFDGRTYVMTTTHDSPGLTEVHHVFQ